MFKKYSTPQRNNKFKNALIQLRGEQCECCLATEWLEHPIKLELHHVDGDRSNLELSNLKLLCPNCHAYTDNYCLNEKSKKPLTISDEDFIKAIQNNISIRQALFSLGVSDTGANYKRAKNIIEKYGLENKRSNQPIYNFCQDCGMAISKGAIRCVQCENINRKTYQISREELKELIRTQSFTSIAKRFNVSDTAIRKWCDKYNLPRKKKDIQIISDENWKLI